MKTPENRYYKISHIMFWKMSVTCVFNEKLLLAWTCVFCVRIFFPPLPQQLSCHAGFSVWPCHFSAQH